LRRGALVAVLLVLGAVVVIGLGKGLDSLIESQIFYPDREMVAGPGDYSLDYEDIRITTPDGVRIHGWFVPALEPVGMILFAHGNAGNISHRLDNVARLVRSGLSVLIFDYRGYGLSDGRLSEQGMYMDAGAAFELALERAREAGLKVVIFGRSLGGVAAVQLAAEHPRAGGAKGVILESTFTNLSDMARLHFPLPLAGKAVRGRMDSLSRIGRVSSPLLFFHGDRDDLVPRELGRSLFRAAPEPKEFVTIQGAGHNDTYPLAGEWYFEKIRSFVEGL
jgi:fermentation-respiration switch protein FrsA (DUF1100 family)